MKLVARIESTRNIKAIAESLANHVDEISVFENNIFYVYFSGTIAQLKDAVKVVKKTVNYSNQIKIMYGTSTTII